VKADERYSAVLYRSRSDESAVETQRRQDQPRTIQGEGIKYEESCFHREKTQKASRLSEMPLFMIQV
jgi:hypothetical protein